MRTAAIGALCLAGVLSVPAQAATIPGTVHLRGGDTIQAKDIRIDGLEEPGGIEITTEDKEYRIERSRIAGLAFKRVKETEAGLIGPDSRIKVTLRNGKTVTASNILLGTRAHLVYQGDLVNGARTGTFTINGSREATYSDPDDIVRIRFTH